MSMLVQRGSVGDAVAETDHRRFELGGWSGRSADRDAPVQCGDLETTMPARHGLAS